MKHPGNENSHLDTASHRIAKEQSVCILRTIEPIVPNPQTVVAIKIQVA